MDWDTNVSLGAVLKNELYIPEYQRDYAWENDEAYDFMEDLVKASKRRNKAYLFGQFIFHKNGDRLDVIDGQQRIVTAVIFLSIVRGIVDDLDIDKGDEDPTEFNSTVNSCIGTKKKGFKLHLKGKSENFFRSYIQDDKDGSTKGIKYKPNRNISVVKDTIQKYMDELIAECDSDLDKFVVVHKLTMYLTDKFVVAMIKTDDLADAYTIFETLNSRGKDLEAADLVKNHMFKLCREGRTGIETEWTEMSDKLSDKGASVSVSSLIRYYWNSRNEYVRKRQIYRSVSESITDSAGAERFVSDLNELCDVYLLMMKPDTEVELFNDEIKGVIKGLYELNNKIYYPLLLALVSKGANNQEICRLLREVESLTVRNVVLGNRSSNAYDVKLSGFAKDISDGTPVDEIVGKIQGLMIDDEELHDSMNVANIKDPRVARYLLSQMYICKYGNELKINSNTSEVNLEHVLPKNPSSDWGVSKEEWAGCVNKLGNMTLLLSSDNSSVSNNTFSEKKKVYANSRIEFNRYFGDIEVWNKTTIMERQEEMFDIVVKRWSKPVFEERLDRNRFSNRAPSTGPTQSHSNPSYNSQGFSDVWKR